MKELLLKNGGETTEMWSYFFGQMWSKYAKKEQAHHSLPQQPHQQYPEKKVKTVDINRIAHLKVGVNIFLSVHFSLIGIPKFSSERF